MRLGQRLADQRRLQVRRIGNVEDLDRWDRRSDASGRLMHLWESTSASPLAALSTGPRGNRDHVEAGHLVGRQMAFGHDHAGADATDRVILDPNLHIGLKPLHLPLFPPCWSGRAIGDHFALPIEEMHSLPDRSRVDTRLSTAMRGWPRIKRAQLVSDRYRQRHHGKAAQAARLRKRGRAWPHCLRSRARP